MLNIRKEAFKDGKLLRLVRLVPVVVALILLSSSADCYADNQVMGEVRFEGVTKAERDSGVWIDGQYLGYLKELKGDKKVILLPGEHQITVRQAGLDDFVRKIVVEPGQKQMVRVAMQKSAGWVMPSAVSTLKLKVQPDRAAVFLDGRYVGHVGEFGRGPLSNAEVTAFARNSLFRNPFASNSEAAATTLLAMFRVCMNSSRSLRKRRSVAHMLLLATIAWKP